MSIKFLWILTITLAVRNRRVIKSIDEAVSVTFGAYPGYDGPLRMVGEAIISSAKDGGVVIPYFLLGLEVACESPPSGVANACGIHVHEGESCSTAAGIGGHYWNASYVSSDPWASITYSDVGGVGAGTVSIDIGYTLNQIMGQVMVLHGSAGERVACAPIPSSSFKASFNSLSAPFPIVKFGAYPGYTGSMVFDGYASLLPGGEDAVAVGYYFTGAEAACITPPSIANACGIHVHAGKNCESASDIGGHYWNTSYVASDPWSSITYLVEVAGASAGGFTAKIGYDLDQVVGQVLVLHDSTGARASCAVISN